MWFYRVMRKAVLALAPAVLSMPCVARATTSECPLFAFAAQPGTPRFAAFPAEQLRQVPRPPDVRTGEARRYRTAIRNGASAGVNFAGRLTIVGWGCGSSCLDWAVVDRATGHVHFEPRYRVVSTVHVDDPSPSSRANANDAFNGLRFRQDSNLLVVQGAPNEDTKMEGLTFLRWTGKRFSRIGFVPASQLCR